LEVTLLSVERHGRKLLFDDDGFASTPYVYSPILKKGALYEEPFLEYIRSLDLRGVYVDIGAHLGTHTVWFATVCPSTRVHAFEPLGRFADVVRRNVTLNELDGKVTLHQVGLSDQPGRATNTLSPEHQWGFDDKPDWVDETFEVAKLDRVLRRRQPVVVMKLDVEGMEASVLRGASRLLSRWRPVVFAEANTVEEKDEIAAILLPYGYTETGRVFNSTPTFEFVAPPRVGKERLRLLTQRVHPFWQRLPKWLRNSVGRKIAARLPETRSWLDGPEPPPPPAKSPFRKNGAPR
jgi:FkbM family methyltransferase